MNDYIDDTLLGAYVDGELSAALVREVEIFLAGNAEAMQKVRTFREINSLLRAAGWEGLFPEAGDRRLTSFLSVTSATSYPSPPRDARQRASETVRDAQAAEPPAY
jgi:anti-sigma factor RsiW